MDQKITLDLSKHCIETEIKRLHNRLISKYLKQRNQDTQLEVQIKALENALIHMDFRDLRSRFSELAGNTTQNIYLLVDSEKNYEIFIDDKLVFKTHIQEIGD